MQIREQLKQHRVWLLALLVITALSLAAVIPVQAGDGARPVRVVHPQHQIFNDNLVVEAGQSFDGDVVVYNGDAAVMDGGRIAGNLIVYSGDIRIEQGGVVSGNLTAVSGDVEIEGRVGGSVAVLSGDAELGDTANVGGDVSVVSGDLERQSGAQVGGSMLRGPQLNIQIPPIVAPGAAPGLGGLDGPMFTTTRPPSLVERWVGFMGRLAAAGAMLLLLAGGAAAVVSLRPVLAGEVHSALRRQPALSFAAGLLVNIVGAAIIGFLFITICLMPFGAVLGLVLLVVNVVGLSATGPLVTERLPFRVGGSSALRAAVGVAVPGAFIALLWLLGGCFTFFGFVLALLGGSFGLGAFLVKVLKLGEPASAPPPSPAAAAPGAVEPVAPAPENPAAAAEPAPAAEAVAESAATAPGAVEPVAPAPENPAAAAEPAPAAEAPAESAAAAPPAAPGSPAPPA